MAYIDCDKCYHGRVCAHRHHYHDMIVECNHHIPTADVVEVKHGEWLGIADFGNGNCIGYCSVCGTMQKAENGSVLKLYHRHCHNCGAKMDGRSDT